MGGCWNTETHVTYTIQCSISTATMTSHTRSGAAFRPEEDIEDPLESTQKKGQGRGMCQRSSQPQLGTSNRALA